MSSTTATSQSSGQNGSILRSKLYLAGINVTHSIVPSKHNLIGRTLFSSRQPPLNFTNAEYPTLQDAMDLFRAPDFAGGVVTMPYKQAIIAELDKVNPLVELLRACNNVHLTKEGRLRVSKTDWRGVKGCLVSGEKAMSKRKGEIEGKGWEVGMIVGAGGASRDAVYALAVELGCEEIYVVDRDDGEIKDLIDSTKAYANFPGLSPPNI